MKVNTGLPETTWVLYVEDDPLDCELVRDALEEEEGGFALQVVSSREEFESVVAGGGFDVVLSDFNIAGFEGLDVLDQVHRLHPTVPVVIVTGTGSEEVAVEAMKRGAADYVIKTPEHVRRLPQTIRAALERRQLRDALGESEQKYRLLFTNETDAIVLVDGDSLEILDANPAAEKIYGYSREECLGMDATRFSAEPEKTAALLRKTARDGHGRAEGRLHRRKDGVTFPIETSLASYDWGGRRVVCGIIRDISERKTLEQQLVHSQKMEAIGRLAGGIAHDFNNLLTAIVGHAEIALSSPAGSRHWRAYVEEIKNAGERASNLTRQLLSFARRQVVEPQVVLLNELVSQTNSMLRRLIGEHIALQTKLQDDLWTVEIDPGQMENVLVNLAVNARDAMPAGGTLEIETANLPAASPEPVRPPALAGRDLVTLVVRDTGVGIPTELIEHVFEPFFTTKKVGEGTGLGLASSYGVVTQAGGEITVGSAPGRGTVFCVFLPRARAGTVAALAPGATESVEGGTETILLVEDEPAVRGIAELALSREGYTVIPTKDGDEALRAAREHGEAIDLLLSDVVLPGRGGPEIARELLQDRPSMKLLLMSGYSDDALLRELPAETSLLQKPFTPSTLARKVREVLDGSD